MSTLPTYMGSQWQLAVGVPIVNPSFRYPKAVNYAISTAYATGVSLLVTDATDEARREVRPAESSGPYNGDVIKVGPSSEAGNEGRIETRRVTVIAHAAGVTTFTIDSALDYDYAIGDAVTGFGTRCADGWELRSQGVDLDPTDPATAMQNYANADCEDASLFPDGATWGYDDLYYAQGMHTDLSSTAIILNQYVPNYTAPAGFGAGHAGSVKYRLGGAFIGLVADAAEASIQMAMSVNSGVNWVPDPGFSCTTSENAWALSDGVDESNMDPVENGTRIIIFGVVSNPTGTFRVDCLFAEHASGLSVWNTGYLTLGELPDLSTLTITPVPSAQVQRLLANRAVSFDNTGAAARDLKWVVRCQMPRISASDWTDIKTLLYWQARGNPINLHTGIPELPPTVQGWMVIDRILKPYHDLTYRALDFTFLEA